MTELETRLADLADDVGFPETPDLLSGARDRLASPRRSGWGVRLVVAAAVLAAALGAVLAVSPGARSAFLELFHIHGATISRVDALPRAGAKAGWAPGVTVSLAEAQRRVDFRIRLPRASGERRVRNVLFDPRGGGVVSLVWCCEPTVILTQFVGDALPYIQKFASQAATIDRVVIDGKPGYWVAGGPHVVVFRDADGVFQNYELRVSGNVLLWVDDGVTLRLEGKLEKSEALEIAASVR